MLEPTTDGAPAAAAAEATGRTARIAAWGSILLLIASIVASLLVAFNPQWIDYLGQWGYVGAFVISLVASASVVLPIPGLPVAMAMGTALNPFLLGLVTGFASALGETVGYLAGKGGRTLVERGKEMQYHRIEAWTQKYGAFAVFLAAIFPLPLFDLAGLAAGAMRMPFWQFFVAAFLGKTIKYTVAILLAAGAVVGVQEWLR